ncbi:ATP12 family chaperone protein [Erythrobacter sp.]|uniref:ATP12 family chaperone protein n=1 Tax=Erythrobacter sp. TaxID=1042 RepID=UPI003C772C82
MKRFWKDVNVVEREGGWQVALDDRGVKSVGGAPQIVPSRALAEELAKEWARQGETIDPRGFPFRDLADYAIDMVARDPAAVVEKTLRYGDTDTLLYRADPDEPLHARQLADWEPIVAGFEREEQVELVRVSGIVHRPQPDATTAHLRQRLSDLDPFALAGTEMMASLAASLVIALEAGRPHGDAEALWQAASLEEEWQADLWGRDEEAEERRKGRAEQFAHAARWVRLANT